MKRITCEACCSNQLKKYGQNILICDFCGSKYIVNENEEVKSEAVVHSEIVNLLIKASVAYAKGNYEETLNQLGQALKLDDTNAVTLNKIGMCYRKLYQNDLARDFYEKAIAADPNFGAGYGNSLIYLLYITGTIFCDSWHGFFPQNKKTSEAPYQQRYPDSRRYK